jgi:hypothetical protein
MSGFLSLEKFLSHFNPIEITKEDFIKKFTVMYSKPQSLQEIFDLVPASFSKKGKAKVIIKNPETDKRFINKDAVVDYFYKIIVSERYKYLSCFYEAYFNFKHPDTMDWTTSDNKKILSYPKTFEPFPVVSSQKNDASRRIVRNLFYLQLLHETKVTNTVKSHVSFWESLTNMYNKLQLEDRFFAPSSIDQLLKPKPSGEFNYNIMFYLFQAYQPKASIFNPYTIKWVLDNLVVPKITTDTQKGDYKVFTPVLSWGSYLIAYLKSDDYSEYVGVDVMQSVCDKCQFLSQSEIFKIKKSKFYCQPSESLLLDKKFIAENQSNYDTVLVCPPYYDMEIYSEGQQSIESYKTYEEWLSEYWEKTVFLCHKLLKPGAVFCYIANDYHSLKGDKINLVADLKQVVDKYFNQIEMVYLQNRTSPLRVNAKDRTERLFICKK